MKDFRHRRFRIIRLLGEGGMGRVYLAEDLLLNQSRLALKVYPPRTPAEHLRREFLALRELRHPGIARAFHFGTSESDGAPFFTMEYIAGDPLDRHLRAVDPSGSRSISAHGEAGSPAQEPRAAFLLRGLDLFIQAAAAAGHLHRRGLLHLDLKPANILVLDTSPEGGGDKPVREGASEPAVWGRPLLVLIDFGLIRALSGGAEGVPRRGTVPFMAPEIFEGGKVDARTDIYALGVTFYLALTGRYPFEASSVDGWALAHRSLPPAPAPELPDALERILHCALAKNPGKRFADALVLERALLSARSELRPRGKHWSPPPVEPELAGRDRELSRFDEWKDRGRRGRPLLLVSGPDGIGKSRLLAAMETRLEISGGTVVWIRSGAEEEAPLLTEAVRRTALLYPERMRSKRDGAGWRLLGSRAGLFPPDAGTRRLLETIPPDEVLRIARRVAVKRLAALLRKEPVFLLVDDLDGADPDGREFLLALAAALTPAAWASAAAGRSGPGSGPERRGPDAELRGGIIAALRSAPEATGPVRSLLKTCGAGAAWLNLGPLSIQVSRRILEASSGGLSSERALPLTEIHRRAGGNPLYLLEELRAFGEKRAAGPAARDLKDRLRRRLEELPDLRRRLAIFLALAGRPLTIEVLARASGASADDLSRAARQMAIAGILAGGAGRPIRFVHRSIADLAVGLVPLCGRADIHRAIAEALEALHASRADMAHHLFEAGEPEKAIALVEEMAIAGESTEFENPRALSVLERAARAVGSRSASGRALLEVLGDRLDQAGHFDGARGVRVELAAAAGLSGAERARHHRKLAALCHRMGDPAEAERQLGKALEIFGMKPPDPPSPRKGSPGGASPAAMEGAPARDPSGERLAALAELALLYHFRHDERATECARMGLLLFSACDRKGRGAEAGLLLQRAIDLHAVAGQISIRRLALDEAVEVLKAGLRLAKAAGTPVNAALLLNNLGLAYHLQSRFKEALEAFRRAQRIADDLGDSAALFTIRCNIAQIHAKVGRFSRALADLELLRGEPAAAQSERLYLNLLYSRALVLSLLGDSSADWDEVSALSSRLGDLFLSGFAAVYKSEARMLRGEWSAARATLKGAGGPAAGRIFCARSARIEAALGFKDRAAAEIERYGKCEEGLPELVDAWNRLYLGQARLDLGDLEAARAEISAAERFFRARRVAPGEIEAALLLADLELRRSATAREGKRAALAAARVSIDRARAVEVDAPAGGSPRLRSLRIDLLLARAELRSALDLPGEGWAERVRDLLAAAGGEAHLRDARELLIQYEALQVAASRLQGDSDSEEAAAGRLALARSRLARVLSPSDRRACARADVFGRLGLPELAPGRRRIGWPPWAAEALAGALKAFAGIEGTPLKGPRAPLEAALACLARPLDASSASMIALGDEGVRVVASFSRGDALPPQLRAGWRPPALLGSRTVPGGTIIECPIRARGEPAGALLVRLRGRDEARDAGALKVIGAFADLFSLGGGLEPAGRPAEGIPGKVSRAAGAIAERTRTLDLEDRPSSVGLLGKSAALRRLARLIAAAAGTEIPVLITGESGTGKEVVARAIHRTSRRAHGPFISQNCTAIPPGLLEADLFGYERGAFTGAEKTKSGFILKAQGGTFLLDEIGDADLATQAKILRVLEERSLRPVGGRRAIPVDVRFMAVTQRDIDSLMTGGGFRQDLFYRLAGLRIHVPPLRERVEDIEVLLVHFLREILGRPVRIAPRARAALEAHPWPGNVRELATVAQRLALEMGGGARIVPRSLVDDVLAMDRPPPGSGLVPPGLLLDRPYPEVKRALELENLRALWLRHRGSLSAMALELHTTVRSVYRHFERLGLKPKDFRQNPCGKNGPC